MQSFISQLDWRFATKSFDSEKKVSAADEATILEAIRKAPTSFGIQQLHVVNVQNPALRETIKSHAWNQPQITEASHLLVFCARNDIDTRIDTMIDMMSGGDATAKESLAGYQQMMKGAIAGKTPEQIMNWSSRQAYLALGFGLAACAELSIDSCPMEGFDPALVHADLNLPAHLFPYAILAIGYRKEDPTHPKFRFPLDEIVSTQ